MQEENRHTRRWFLPFTQNLDLRAIDAALCLADAGRATLIAVSLLATPCEQHARGVRLERLQQAKDFQEVVLAHALRLAVPLERYEEFPIDPIARLAAMTRELDCDGVILASRGAHSLFLDEQELRSLLTNPPASLVLIRLPMGTPQLAQHQQGSRIFTWLQNQRQQDKVDSELRCLYGGAYAQRADADHRSGVSGLDGNHQRPGHQWRRLFQYQLGAS